MAKKLFIVESPKKVRTIEKYLSSEYTIMASVGHIRQIPKKGLNIDVKNDFIATYEISEGKKDVVRKIKTSASSADIIYLATDLDREGEAIAWHIYDLLPKKDQVKCKRISYSEITKKAILAAIKSARNINMDLVDAQKARQCLDRLIGYKVSPVLWYSAHISKSSAGRVQSVALNLVCERQKEIDAFISEDFWYIEALLKADKGNFWAKVVTKEKDNRYKEEKVATKDLEALKNTNYNISKIDRKEKCIKANPPFDTNSLQKACASIFKWSLSKSKTMAQKLYVDGLVTYIRTDSFNIADEAIDEVRGLIKKAATSEYLPSSPYVYSKKSSAATQEAHECIRPTHVYEKGDDIADSDAKKMYKLIRDRFIACQMTPMLIDTVAYHIKTDTNHKLITNGQAVKFDGWHKVYKYSKTKEEILPEVCQGENLDLKEIKKTKHSTKPPARYNEANLADKMETNGVGRPSTRTDIITSIQKKGYVEKEQGKGKRGLIATYLGMKINDYLVPHFKDFFMNIKYTSQIEDELNEIAEGKKNFLEIVNAFYKILTEHIKEAKGTDDVERQEPESTGVKCSACKKEDIVLRDGRFGKFFACNDYKNCKTIYIKGENGKFSPKKKKKFKKLGRKCPECEKHSRDGELIERSNKKTGDKFIGCNKWPACRYTESVKDNSKK